MTTMIPRQSACRGVGKYSPAGRAESAGGCSTCAAGTIDHDDDPSSMCTQCNSGRYAAAGSSGLTLARRVRQGSTTETLTLPRPASTARPEPTRPAGQSECKRCTAGQHGPAAQGVPPQPAGAAIPAIMRATWTLQPRAPNAARAGSPHERHVPGVSAVHCWAICGRGRHRVLVVPSRASRSRRGRWHAVSVVQRRAVCREE